MAQWPQAQRRGLVGVLTDIDDTLTTDGAITADALQALADLKAAGFAVIAITGRPVGWSEPFACSWPVDAIVAENGAVALLNTSQIGLQRNQDKRELLSKLYIQDATTRQTNFARMQQVAQRVLAEVPGTRLSEDSPGRETDIAIDHSEFTCLPPDKIAQVVAILRAEGMHATVSSIHINGWFGEHNKWVGARWIVRSLFGRELEGEPDRWAYVGDSTNDQLMFAALPHSIGVANVRRFEANLSSKPRYITCGERGAGFAEVAQAILAARGAGVVAS
ncbi:HAD superfamily hydrolase (TIGR01484 family) [Rhodoferax ferrireducens]|uniref:HAD superfamily hydrolase (TIGR01484 family) n=1 Tax=Rhodoferax ferrireducens TaxID=192843 RepID=A0ABU2CG03_9BURK|nr:HAD superfamily hydrolase (TIGR01484 family) [Rhodoferax ferrireducens]